MNKHIKDYLRNQKDVYTATWVKAMQAKPMNLAEVQIWLNKIVFIEEELKQLEKYEQANK